MQKAMYRKILFIAVFLACAITLGAQMQDRYALVIGNGSYAELGELKNARNDATDMAAALKDLGFEVTSLIDADLIAMENAVSRFSRQLSTSPNTMGVFYFAGHGVQSNGMNYLIPTDARIPEESYLKVRALPVQAIFEDLQNAKNRLNIIILDACRDNPFSWARSGTRGLSVVSSQPPGSIIVYATSAGSTALEGTGRNGVFTGELLKHLKTSGIDVMEVFNRTGAAVQQATNGKQNPAIYTQFFDKAYFIGGAAEVSASPYTSAPSPSPSQAAGKTPSMVVQKNYGSIAATVQTFGTLLLDGMVMGTVMPNATALLNDVEAGIHEIRMEYASGNVEIKTVEVKKNQQAQVSFERKPFTVLYDSNGATSGTVPADSASYAPGERVTVLGNMGNLVKTAYRFAGWNTKADGTGTSYPPGSSFSMGMEDAMLYAEWNTSMIAAVAAGGASHTMILKTDGTLWATGNNKYGQLGDSTFTDRSTPVQVMDSVQAVVAGGDLTMILKSDSTLWATGRNDFGQLGDGTTTDRHTPVLVMRDVQAVAAGGDHAMILKTDGTLWAIGGNDYGQLGDGTYTNRSTAVQVMRDVQAVSAGGLHTMILKTDGTLWATGHNYYGQLGDGTTTNRIRPVQVMRGVQAVAAGCYHTMILKTDGTLWATGRNDCGQLGNGTYTNRSTAVQVMRDVQAVAAGGYHTMILKTDGMLWATGNNFYGQLGDGTTTNRSTPVRVMSGVQAVAAGGYHTMTLKTDGTLWAVGWNYYGQLGDGTTMDWSMPVQITF